MGLFNSDMLKADQSLFKNEMALDYEFLPKLLPYREAEQRHFATCIQPLLQSRNGRNLFIHGAPGIGKTAALKFVFRELEEESDDVIPIYINCWQKNTSFKVAADICDQLGYKMVHNKRTEELFQIAFQMINKKAAVFTFDEVDKVEDFDFLYAILENVFKKTIFLITNHKEWLLDLDIRIKSRMNPEIMEFRKYNLEETKGILQQRIEYGFVEGCWEDEAINMVAAHTLKLEDIRSGFHLLREAGFAAEEMSAKKIDASHVESALAKLEDFAVKPKSDLDEDAQFMLEIIKKNSGEKIGNLFKKYQEEGGKSVYKTFQRKIRKLADNKFVSVQKVMGGAEGTTTIVSYSSTKRLTEF